MNIYKDKNFFCFTMDETPEKVYRFNINTSEYIGVKGAPIKALPPAYKRAFLNHKCNETSLALYYVQKVLEHYFLFLRSYNQDLLTFFDKVDSLKDSHISNSIFRLLCHNEFSILSDITELNFKEAIAFLKGLEKNTSCFEINKALQAYKFKQKYTYNDLTWTEITDLCNRLDDKPTQLDVHLYEYYLTAQLMRYMQLDSLVRTYLKQCHEMGVEPRKNNNPIREFAETDKRWRLWKKKKNTETLVENYRKHSKAWGFEFGDFTVCIPACGDDLVIEGAKMHHCVGSYVRSVIEGQTYICFVRHKDTPDVPYITCQVTTEGQIKQYYLAYDKHISSDEDIAFKNAYQEYLDSVWNEEV